MMLPAWLIAIVARTGLSGRALKIVAAIVAIAFAALVVWLLAMAFDRWLAGQRRSAVAIDRRDVTIEAANRVMAADREAAGNAAGREAAFQNDQDNIAEAIDEAQRTRTSPLDAAFDRLR